MSTRQLLALHKLGKVWSMLILQEDDPNLTHPSGVTDGHDDSRSRYNVVLRRWSVSTLDEKTTCLIRTTLHPYSRT